VIQTMSVDYPYPFQKAIWRPVKRSVPGIPVWVPEKDSMCIKEAVCNHNGQLS
jgi:hypothetical protein